MLLNYKYEIFPTQDQVNLLQQWIDLCRHTYNSALLDKQRAYKEEQRTLNRMDLQRIQTADKKRFPELKTIPSQPLQEVLFRLEKAYQNFFRGDAKYPKIKKHKEYCSLTFTQFGMAKQKQKNKKTGLVSNGLVRRAVSFGKGGKLLISKLGLVDIDLHRKLDGRIKQVTIKHKVNRWFATFVVEKRAEPTVSLENALFEGLDLGINKYAVLSDGYEIANPKFLQKSEKKLKRAQRKLSKRVKGSKNWYKQLRIVQNLQMKVANQRKDFLHKQTYRLSRFYTTLAMEDLKVRNMVRNRKVSKSISDAGWFMFRSFLTYKMEQMGHQLILVNPAYTTQECSNCGNHVKKSLSVRTHVCGKCGTVLCRDLNAAINIKRKALEQVNLQPIG